MPLPVPDKNIPALYRTLYEGRELELMLQAFELYPTYRDERGCVEKCKKKELLRRQYADYHLKKTA